MKRFKVAVQIIPRAGLLDPQGKAVADALHALGFSDVSSVHVGRHVLIEMSAPDAMSAESAAQAMCQRLLANPVTEDFEITSAVPA
jgi:phosphoribosylformylglycinamidine synthase subunit PurS